ncbi:MAG: hypothetical protein A2X48_01480 [Lentisphaerae bacterium GWF2_49_21]|nr:MAG: hypothetical protein A2X48_01480 [Lentisphaerae bacterium GWF2_49_21]
MMIQNRIIAGVFIVIPIGITIWLAVIFFDLITDWIDPVLENLNLTDTENQWLTLAMRGASLLVTLAVLFIIGQIAKWALGRRLMLTFERIVLEIPMVSTIYSTAKQVVDAMKGSEGGLFKKVVLVEYPRKGLYAMGFMTNENKSENELSIKTGTDLICVFMPFAPPTAGNLIFVPRSDCIFLEMRVSDGMKLIISGGVAAPEYPYKKAPPKN